MYPALHTLLGKERQNRSLRNGRQIVENLGDLFDRRAREGRKVLNGKREQLWEGMCQGPDLFPDRWQRSFVGTFIHNKEVPLKHVVSLSLL